VQYRHFAKKTAGPEPGKHASLVLTHQAGDLHFTFDDDVKAVTRVALLKDVASGFVGLELGGLLQSLQLRSEHAGEQFVRLKNNHRGALYWKEYQRKAQRWRRRPDVGLKRLRLPRKTVKIILGRQQVQDKGDLRGFGHRAGPCALRMDAGEGVKG